MYRTMLARVDSAPGSNDCLEAACSLALDHRARLVGIAARFPPPSMNFVALRTTGSTGSLGISRDQMAAAISPALPCPPRPMTSPCVADAPDAVRLACEQIEEELSAAKARFFRLCGTLDLATEWRADIDLPARSLIKAAGIADLIIIARADREFGAFPRGDVLLGAGRPVLVIPPGVKRLKARNILIGWKNTAQAKRAIADALPFLKRAERVVLAHVDEHTDESDALAEAGGFLHAHDIDARVETIRARPDAIGEALAQFARRGQFDLIVVGAYGHGRFREWAFGGVTRDLLRDCPLPCLFSH